MPAQLANVAEAALGRPPTVEEFITRVNLAISTLSHTVPPPDSALFGGTLDVKICQPQGTENTQKVAVCQRGLFRPAQCDSCHEHWQYRGDICVCSASFVIKTACFGPKVMYLGSFHHPRSKNN